MFWVATAFFTATAFQLGTYFYAEPIMALFALAGWERVRGGRGDVWGWLLLGAAGWFKNEGILALPACWFAMRLLLGRKAAPALHLMAGLALPVAWHAGCRLAGGGVYDFAPVWHPDWSQAWAALARAGRLAFLEPWRYGFAFPLAVLGWFAPAVRSRPFATAGMASLAMTAAYAGIFSLSRAMDFSWHLDSIERLMWLPALLLAREILQEAATVSRRPGNALVAARR